MSYKDEALEFLGITRWHELGYKGKGIKIMSGEKIQQKAPRGTPQELWDKVICPSGYKTNKDDHGSNVMRHILAVCPEAECIALPFNVNADGKGYKSTAVDYIMQNNVTIFTTSYLFPSISEQKKKAMRDCIDKGCTFFVCSGNGEGDINEEAKAEEYICIGGVKPRYKNGKYDWNDLYHVSYSNEGEEIDYSTIAEVLGSTGTSFYNPIFAPMCVLVQEFFLEKTGRTLNRSELISFINDNLIDVEEEGFDIKTGYGLFKLPKPETIKISDYVTDTNVGDLNENIYYGGIPQVEDIKIKQMLLTPSEYTRPQTPIKPTAIAWHYVGNPNSTALANRNYFEGLKDSHKTKASCHYIIGLEGEIIQCIPDLEKSYCTNEANDYAISVECCHPDSTGKFAEATYKSMLWLGKYLMQKYSIKNNIRHYDVTGKICPKWFVDNPNEWEKFKDDLEVEEVLRYKTVEEIPEYYRKDIQELIDRGIIAGRGGEAGLDLSDDMCRMAIYAKKIFEIGAK